MRAVGIVIIERSIDGRSGSGDFVDDKSELAGFGIIVVHVCTAGILSEVVGAVLDAERLGAVVVFRVGFERVDARFFRRGRHGLRERLSAHLCLVEISAGLEVLELVAVAGGFEFEEIFRIALELAHDVVLRYECAKLHVVLGSVCGVDEKERFVARVPRAGGILLIHGHEGVVSVLARRDFGKRRNRRSLKSLC